MIQCMIDEIALGDCNTSEHIVMLGFWLQPFVCTHHHFSPMLTLKHHLGCCHLTFSSFLAISKNGLADCIPKWIRKTLWYPGISTMFFSSKTRPPGVAPSPSDSLLGPGGWNFFSEKEIALGTMSHLKKINIYIYRLRHSTFEIIHRSKHLKHIMLYCLTHESLDMRIQLQYSPPLLRIPNSWTRTHLWITLQQLAGLGQNSWNPLLFHQNSW